MFNYVDSIDNIKQRIIMICLVVPLLYFIYKFIKITHLNNFTLLQNYYDYFQIQMIAYSLVVFGMFCFTKKSFRVLNFIGKRSTVIFFQHWILYIFLYHIWQPYAVKSGMFFYPLLVLMFIACTYIPALVNSIVMKNNLG